MNESSKNQELRAENQRLRTLLAITYSGYKLFSEDGKLEDTSEMPFIDFKNDSVGDIDRKMMARSTKKRPVPKEGKIRTITRAITTALASAAS